jgi:hypothetical protein
MELAGAHIGVSAPCLVHQRKAANGQEPSATTDVRFRQREDRDGGWRFHPQVGERERRYGIFGRSSEWIIVESRLDYGGCLFTPL